MPVRNRGSFSPDLAIVIIIIIIIIIIHWLTLIVHIDVPDTLSY